MKGDYENIPASRDIDNKANLVSSGILLKESKAQHTAAKKWPGDIKIELPADTMNSPKGIRTP